MLPAHEEEDAYAEEEPPTIPRTRAPKISGVVPRPPAYLHDDDLDEDTDVDRPLPADEEPQTAKLPGDEVQRLRRASAHGSKRGDRS